MKYIFLDIDGTILSRKKGISHSTIKTLHELKEKGHKIFLNTGRTKAELSDKFYEFNFDGFVCAAGSYIFVEDELVLRGIIEEENILKIVQKINELNLNFGLEGEEYTYFDEFALNRYYSLIEEFKNTEEPTDHPFHEYYIQPENVKSYSEYLENRTTINKMIVFSKNKDLFEILEKNLPKEVKLIKYEDFGEIVLTENDKFTGIEKVLEHYNADFSQSIAVGDSMNDYEMIKYAKLGIAMGNANDEVKAVADYVTDHINEDGFRNAMIHFKLI